MSATRTVAPSFASSVAVARPMPEPAPVTRATLFWTRPGAIAVTPLLGLTGHGRPALITVVHARLCLVPGVQAGRDELAGQRRDDFIACHRSAL
jgi:hypothetical protein